VVTSLSPLRYATGLCAHRTRAAYAPARQDSLLSTDAGLHVSRHHLDRLLKIGSGAELYDIGSGIERRDMSRRCVVGVTAFIEFFGTVREGELQPPLHHVADMRALATVAASALGASAKQKNLAASATGRLPGM
jgi:hypothetical protein